MNARKKITTAARAVRWARYQQDFAVGFGLAALILVLIKRFTTVDWPLALTVAGGIFLVFIAVMVWRGWSTRVTPIRYAHFLDDRFPEFEDSTELLLKPTKKLTAFQKLVHEDLIRRFQSLEDSKQLDAIKPQPNLRPVALFLLLIATVGNAVWLITWDDFVEIGSPQTEQTLETSINPVQLESIVVDLSPPSYTGKAQVTATGGSFEAISGTQAKWFIALDGPANHVQLKMHDDEVLTLQKADDNSFSSTMWSVRNTAYQLLIDGQIVGGSHTVRAIADEAPRVTLSDPTNAVTLFTDSPGDLFQIAGNVVDDFGLDNAVLRVTLALGSGEQVAFREQEHPLNITPSNTKAYRLSAQLDLTDLGLVPGSELYFFVEATDNRAAAPNVGTSGTYVIRWYGEDNIEVLPIDALAVNVLPEYFRSQRQIIIDTELLISQSDEISTMEFAQRAQEIAIDQKLLRLRYGQFLGEEFESDIGGVPTVDEHDDEESEEHDHEAEHVAEQLIDEDDPVMEAIAEVAHFHDRTEQATLFDPETTSLLKQALAAMWDAELQLRLAKPSLALPFEYQALEHLKKVQQSSRIYLSRVGFKPTPIDMERRLTGELDDIQDFSRNKPATPNPITQRIRNMLDPVTRGDMAAAQSVLSLDELQTYLETQVEKQPALLDSVAAVQELKADPNCGECRSRLLANLWQHLDPPLPGLSPIKVSPVFLRYQSLEIQE